jgi:UDP-glucose 4-epimerase
MKVLITGGAGFLGAWIAKRLLSGGHQVRVFDRSNNRTVFDDIVGAPGKTVEWKTGDIASREDVVAALDGCGGVIHLAAILTPDCRAQPQRAVDILVSGTINVFEAARHHKLNKVVYASSAGVFGPESGSMPRPMTLYGTFKLACEGIGRSYALDYGIASVGFRPFIVYGPGRETGVSAGVSIACREAAFGRPYVIPFSGVMDLIYVDDVAAGFEAAVLRPVTGAHAFNILGEVGSIDQVIAEIRKARPDAKITVDGPVQPIASEIAHHDLKPVLGDIPVTPLAKGIRETIAFYDQRR